MIYDDECEAVGGMRISRGNRNTPRKPTPAPLCTQIPRDLNWARTLAAAMENLRLTAWGLARPVSTHVRNEIHWVFVGKLDRKRQPGRLECRHRDNVKGMNSEDLGCIRLPIMANDCEHANKRLWSIKCKEFLEQLKDTSLLKEGCSIWTQLCWW
jgi:hypothetical protein